MAVVTVGGRHVLQVIEALELVPIGRALAPWATTDVDATLTAVQALADGLYEQSLDPSPRSPG